MLHTKDLRNLKNVLFFFYSELFIFYRNLGKLLWKYSQNFEKDYSVLENK